MKKKIKIAFIGAGRVFKHYLLILDKIKKDDYEIVAICDKKKKLINHYRKKIKSNFFLSKESLIKSKIKPDVVFILTPSGLHYEHSLFF